LSIFGISVLDNFGLEFLSNFLSEIRIVTASIIGYLSATEFYSFVVSLFRFKEDISNQTKISLRDRPLSEQYSENETKMTSETARNRKNYKISE
jgi:hypothetical protein